VDKFEQNILGKELYVAWIFSTCTTAFTSFVSLFKTVFTAFRAFATLFGKGFIYGLKK